MSRPTLLFLFAIALSGRAVAADGGGGAAPAAQQAGSQDQVDPDQLYDLGKALFDQYAPDEIKKEYEFPSREQWSQLLPRLQNALQGNSLQDLAALEPEARQALAYLQTIPEASDLADWLKERLDLIEAAKALSKPAETPPTPLPPSPVPPQPTPRPPAPRGWNIPAYDYFYTRISHREAPASARSLMPVLQRSFAAEQVPVALSWLAEVESSLNPSARSPAGAKGLFQLMPDTAKSMGLSTWMPDERTQPDKSAHAAARLLRRLRDKFGDWPLAIAAYNAGEGRIRRLLAKTPGAKTFADIAASLPVETRLYVPKVLATIAVRTGVTPDHLDSVQE